MVKKTFYITTAIDYVNGNPHVGHAYEKVMADVLARWHRILGEDVFFLTGTDDNASKNEEAAKNAKIPVREFVDKNAENFKVLCKKLNLSNDDFIRTVEPRHVKVAQEVFKKVYEKGDIYKGSYESLYCEGCEAFYTEKDLIDGKCPEHNKKLEYKKEDGYFFKLSKYKDQIIKLIEKDRLIVPKEKSNEILNRLKSEDLKDLSVSRINKNWGIKTPIDDNHTIYVWFDALINYYSATRTKDKEKYWPPDVHLIGKGINWFHSVIWPGMLFSAEIKQPKKVLVHGYLTVNGKKIGKSLGNVIDPIHLIEKYGSDSLRYFLVREIKFMEDGDFSEEALKSRINNELANDLGNLISRVLTICEKNFDGKIKHHSIDKNLESQLNLKKVEELMESYNLTEALNEIWSFVKSCNKHINDNKIWELSGEKQEAHLYNLLEGIRISNLLLSPFIPGTSENISKQIGVNSNNIRETKFGLTKEYTVKKSEILFQKIK